MNDLIHLDRLSDDVGCEALVWEILKQVDDEFVPPLSTRSGPLDTQLKKSPPGQKDVSGPVGYFSSIKSQATIVQADAVNPVGFLSYRRSYEVPEFHQVVDAYVSTIAVARSYRKQGVARRLYTELFRHLNSTSSDQLFPVATRTWSTNHSHIELVRSFGFEVVSSVPSGRAEGVDTIICAIDKGNFERLVN